MNLDQIKNLSNHNLLSSLTSLFERERKISHSILLHLKIIIDRRLFEKRGFSSLFEMLVKEYKLSETSANQRLKALELLVIVPGIEASLINGDLNLTTLALAQRQIRQEEKLTSTKVGVAQKIEIVSKIKNKTQAQAEIELMKLLPHTSSAPKTVERRISEDTTRVSLNVPDRLKEKLKRLQELWAHVDHSMDYIKLIERSVDDTLSRIDPILKKPSKKKVSVEDNAHHNRSVALTVKIEKELRKVDDSSRKRPSYYSVDIRKKLSDAANSCCEFIDELTSRRCSSRFGLEIDHVVPLGRGGSNDISNLRLLCRAHNLLLARRWFGDDKIDREIRKRRE
jgi:5-methylcytosine-specific restriction endonuclease McrA